MHRTCALLILAAFHLHAEEWPLEKLFTRPFVWGTTPSQLAWAKHARKLGFLWNERGGTFRDLYIYDADSRKLVRLTDLEGLKDPINNTPAETDPRRKNFVPPPPGLTDFDISEDGAQAAFSYRGDLFLVSTQGGGTLRRLTKTKAAESNPQFSTDGKFIAFTQGGQLYVQNLLDATLEQRTDVHPPAALTSYHWSPDGKYFSYSVRTKPGRTMPLPNYSGRFVTASTFRRDVAGDEPIAVQHFLIERTGDNPPRKLETGKGFGFRPPVWSEDSKMLALATQTQDYKTQEIRVVDANTGKSTVVFHQHDDRWIAAADLGWDPTSKHLWFTSDRSGFQHLYSVAPNGSGLEQITKGNWEIHNDPFSHSPQWIGAYLYYSSTAAGTAQRQLYRVHADGASQPEQLSHHEGLNIGWLSDDGTSTAIMQADLQNPFDLFVDGKRVTTSPQPGFAGGPWVQSRFLVYPSLKDKKPVAARLLLPPGYNPDDPNAKPRPAVIYIHGAGSATSVLKQWGSYQELRFVFNNFLARQGYPVLEMDYRGSTNYGRDWRTGVYLDMGGPDLDDVLGGVEYLRGLHNIDMKNTGIWGWSYGGFMTAMALFRAPGTFKAGAAVSGVYDWNNYNAGYTEQRLTTPAQNPEAYQRSSPINFTRQLEDHLLILHGIVDDNVLFQEAVQLTEKLVNEGKLFEEAFYPEESHAYLRDRTLQDAFGRMAQFFHRQLESQPIDRQTIDRQPSDH